MAAKTIAVLFGGRSPEHDVSVVSALQVMGALDRSLYSVIPVYLATDGRWWTGEALMKQGGTVKNWKTRWFVLTHASIACFVAVWVNAPPRSPVNQYNDAENSSMLRSSGAEMP